MRFFALALVCLATLTLVAAEREEPPAERRGVDRGVITELSPVRGALTLRSDQGYVRAYIPQWKGGMPKEGGGPDPVIVERLRTLAVGDRVELAWEWEEHYRLVKIRREGEDRPREGARAGAPEGAPEGNRPGDRRPEHPRAEAGADARHPLADQIDAAPAATAGTYEGTVLTVDPKGLLTLKMADGSEQRLVPRWLGGMPKDGGGFDQAMVAQIAQLQPGQRVRAAWEWDERPRVVTLTRY